MVNGWTQNSMVLGLLASVTMGQSATSPVQLPPDLADPGTPLINVIGKSPVNGAYLGWCDGPLADSVGNVYMGISQDGPGIWKITPDGTATKFANGMTQGMEFDSQGRLLACNVDSGLRRFDRNGNVTLLDKTRVKDLSQGSNGGMYLCDHGSMLYFRSAAGVLTPIPGQSNATGVKWIEERKTLYVDDPGKGGVFKFTATEDGVLTNRQQIATYSNTDGLEVDEKGNLYITNWHDGTIDVLNPADNYKILGKITIQNQNPAHAASPTGNCTNITWGGPGNHSLFITGDGGLYRVTFKVAGRTLPGSATSVRNRIAMRLGNGSEVAQGSVPAELFSGRGIIYLRFAGRQAKGMADGRVVSFGQGIHP